MLLWDYHGSSKYCGVAGEVFIRSLISSQCLSYSSNDNLSGLHISADQIIMIRAKLRMVGDWRVGEGVWGFQLTILTINKWSRVVSGVSVIIIQLSLRDDDSDGCSCHLSPGV